MLFESEKWCWANLFVAIGAFVDVGVRFHLLFVEGKFRGCYDEFEGPPQVEQTLCSRFFLPHFEVVPD